MYNVPFVAKLLNCTDQSVRNLISKGLLKINNHKISTKDLLDYLIDNRKWSTELEESCLNILLKDADTLMIPRPMKPNTMQIEELIHKIKSLPYEDARRLFE